MKYTRNSDLNYYRDHPAATNCGSYALRLNEWYDPETYLESLEDGDVYEWIDFMAMNGYSDDEITEIYIDILVEGMLQEFDGELELCDGRAPSTPNIELIAFNGFCTWNEDYDIDADFHFKVLRDGRWCEKSGSEPVEFCDKDDWHDYTGIPVYMYHRIGA